MNVKAVHCILDGGEDFKESADPAYLKYYFGLWRQGRESHLAISPSDRVQAVQKNFNSAGIEVGYRTKIKDNPRLIGFQQPLHFSAKVSNFRAVKTARKGFHNYR